MAISSPLSTADAFESRDSLPATPASSARRSTLRLSVVIPVYNERDTVRELVQRVQSVGLHEEIILVDDGSSDGTKEILAELAAQPDILVVHHSGNRGKGAALRTGFARASGNVILVQDADLEYDPKDYHALLAPLERGEADVVYGSRVLADARQDTSLLYRTANRALTAVSNLFTGLRLTDMETCYKVFRRELLDTITLKEDRFGFEPELTAKLARRKARIVEVPVRYTRRRNYEGKKIDLRDGVNALWCIIRYGTWD